MVQTFSIQCQNHHDMGGHKRRYSNTSTKSHPRFTGQTVTANQYAYGCQVGYLQHRKKSLESKGLGLIQATISNVIWQKYKSLSTAKEVLDALETKFGAAGGAQTYLQLVNMVKIQITDPTDLLLQIQQFQDNCNLTTASSWKTLQHSYSAQVSQTHMNQLPGNTLIISLLLPITNSLTSSRESFKRRIGKKPMPSDRVPPLTSSQL